MKKFQLSENYVKKYADKKVNWGFGEMGYFVYKRTYARPIYDENGNVERTEQWHETVQRVVEGCFTYQKKHCAFLGIPWDNQKAQKSAQIMYDKIFNFKFTPPGRGIWSAGTEFVERHGSMALQNCFAYETEFFTKEGVKRLGNCVGTKQIVLSKNGKWTEAEIKSFGKQKLYKLTLKRGNARKEIFVTNDHDWFILHKNKRIKIKTHQLKQNDKLTMSYEQSMKSANISWKVETVTDTDRFEEVYCAVEPIHHAFTLDGNILTGNCGFVSTERIDIKNTEPFEWLMNALMNGVGCGFDVLGAGKIIIKQPAEVNSWTKEKAKFIVPDSREGWVEALRWKLKSYFEGKPKPHYDYSLVRKKGEPIKGFGGVASGPEPLKNMLEQLDNILQPLIGKKITTSAIVDICNIIACCIVVGGVRRSAELVLGDIDNDEYINLKNPDKNPEKLASHRWASNNSIYGYVGETDYSKVVPLIIKNGEPGIVWIDNCRKFGRMNGKPDYKDMKAMGVNPCLTYDNIIKTDKGDILLGELIGNMKNGSNYKALSYNVKTEKNEWNDIIWGDKTKENTTIIELEIEENGRVYTLKCTPDHEIYTKNRGKVRAEDLNEKDNIIVYNQISKLKSKKILKQKEDEYDITVENNHNFYCNGVLVSNCSEQVLESYESCNLVEVFPTKHDSIEEFLETLKYAYLYAKSITLLTTKSPQTNAIMLKNRRIGVSLSGIVDAFEKFGRRNFLEKWCDVGYKTIKEWDEVYSDWLCIPRSKRSTSIKPSGSVSLLSGVSPGIHYPHSKYYIRRIRISDNSKLLPKLKEAGYHIEEDKYSSNTMVISFPVETENYDRSKHDVTVWEQMNNAADLQKYWSDNAISITVSFKEEEEKDIQHALEIFEDKLKCVSFLKLDTTAYEQTPYESITKEQYEEMKRDLKPIKFNGVTEASQGEDTKFCTTDACLNK